MLISELISLGLEVEIKHLKVADYLIGEIAIERKTVSDFIGSMFNKRILNQLEEIKQYPQQILVIEGIDEQELYSMNYEKERKGVHPNAIRGMILSVLLDYKVPIVLTKNYHDSAKFFQVLLNKLTKPKTEFSLNVKKKAYNLREQQQIIIEGFPNIGPKTAKNLLKEFGSIKSIISAEGEKREKVKKILGKKSESFFRIIEENY
jgi:Fanconi anemia group M protein